jgi:hypothetical protein
MNRDDYRCTDHLLSDLWASSYETLSIDLLLFVTTGLIYVKKKKGSLLLEKCRTFSPYILKSRLKY